MPIQFRCPSGHQLAADERHAGKKLRCPKCQAITRIPELAAAADTPGRFDEPRGAPPPLPAREAVSAAAATTIAPPMRKRAAAEASEDSSSFAASDEQQEPAGPRQVRIANVLVATSAAGYRADSYRAQSVYWIAAGLALLTLFHLAPAIHRGQFAEAPTWARIIILMAAVQFGYIAWMTLIPDWSTVWVAMIVFAGVAAIYGAGLAIAVVTPRSQIALLEMDDVRDSARLWCLAVILLTCLLTYVCGRVSHQWRKSYQAGN